MMRVLGLAALVSVAAPALAGGSSALGESYLCPNGTVPRPGQPCPPPEFVVFFASGSSEPLAVASRILDNLVDQHRQFGRATLVITGHADRAGSDRRNLLLSRRRAEAVFRSLRERGVAEALMRIEARGETQPLVETPDEVPEALNRRVEIRFEA